MKNTLEIPTLYRQKWGLLRFTLFFLYQLRNLNCRYSSELPHWGDSKEHPQSIFGAKIRKKSTEKLHSSSHESYFARYVLLISVSYISGLLYDAFFLNLALYALHSYSLCWTNKWKQNQTKTMWYKIISIQKSKEFLGNQTSDH